VIDPSELNGLSVEQRERIAWQLIADAFSQAAAIIGPDHPRAARLERAAQRVQPLPVRPLPTPSGRRPLLQLVP
jgi:hypothetical protein